MSEQSPTVVLLHGAFAESAAVAIELRFEPC